MLTRLTRSIVLVSKFRQISKLENSIKYYSNNPINTQPLGTIKRETGKLQLCYTCKICQCKNIKIINKIAYQKGVVIVKCDDCKNNHLIADNLKWFSDENVTIEDILKAKGEKIVKVSTMDGLELVSKEEN